MCKNCLDYSVNRGIPPTAIQQGEPEEHKDAYGNLDVRYIYYECQECHTLWTYTEDWGPTGNEKSYSYKEQTD